MEWFAKAWPIFVAVASMAVTAAGFVQTVLGIVKSRYELKKLREEDKTLQATARRREGAVKPEGRLYDRSAYYHENLDYALSSLARWLVVTVFLIVTILCYVYFTFNIYKHAAVADQLRTQLSVLQRANTALGDSLKLLHAMHDRRQNKENSFP